MDRTPGHRCLALGADEVYVRMSNVRTQRVLPSKRALRFGMSSVLRRIQHRGDISLSPFCGEARRPASMGQGRQHEIDEAGTRGISLRLPKSLPAVHVSLPPVQRLSRREIRMQPPKIRPPHSRRYGCGRLLDRQTVWVSDQCPIGLFTTDESLRFPVDWVDS